MSLRVRDGRAHSPLAREYGGVVGAYADAGNGWGVIIELPLDDASVSVSFSDPVASKCLTCAFPTAAKTSPFA